MPKVISLVTLKLTGLISLCGCLTLRVGNHKMKPDKKKIEEFKKEFQTSNYSANEYMKWRRSGIIGTRNKHGDMAISYLKIKYLA